MQRLFMKDRMDGFLIKEKTKAFFLKEGMKEKLKRFFCMEQEGIGVVEVILILVIIISLVVIFRTQITELVKKAFTKITTDTADFW